MGKGSLFQVGGMGKGFLYLSAGNGKGLSDRTAGIKRSVNYYKFKKLKWVQISEKFSTRKGLDFSKLSIYLKGKGSGIPI